MLAEVDIETTPIYFACEVLGLNPYPWQERALTWFEDAVGKRLKASVLTPNGAGKDSIIIATLALWWISIHARGRVVITSKDARQIDEQTMPALIRHRSKFGIWKWIERSIETPTGGKIIAFTTDDEKRCEGFHRETRPDGKPSNDGPLLLIANEAKSIDEGIFEAFDRCTYDALLYTSSPGLRMGRFFESQVKESMGFKRLKAGLMDCPHIPKERIDDIIRTYGEASPFTQSTLYGNFMDLEGEARFDLDGLKLLRAQEAPGKLITLQRGTATGRITMWHDDAGWIWLDEPPQPGAEYLMFCDPNTCEQAAGTSDRDNTAAGILRRGYVGGDGITRPDHVVAVMHWPDGVKWDSDVLAERMKLLSDWYGGCTAVVEANNFGSALMKGLQAVGVPLWRRTKVDDVNPNKKVQTNGFLTTERTREHWVQACAKALRAEQDPDGSSAIGLLCRYKPATDEFHSFLFTPEGRAEAQPGTHDDWVAGIGIGLTVRCFSPMPKVEQYQRRDAAATGRPVTAPLSRFGACG